MEQIIQLLPDEHRMQVRKLKSVRPNEFRMVVGQPMLMRFGDREVWLQPEITASMIEMLVLRACRQSVYAHKETISQGFIILDGGHRMGISGVGVLQNGLLQNITQISSVVIRVANAVVGFAEQLSSMLSGSALVIGPPCSGKTTLLRDITRQLSDEQKFRVSLVDERGEVAAALNGVPQLYVGKRTDVLSRVPKAHGIMMMLRTMNPQWMVVDEITLPEDIRAMEQASYCGVKLLASAHADCQEDLYRRPLYRNLMEVGLFRMIIQLDTDRTYKMIEVNI